MTNVAVVGCGIMGSGIAFVARAVGFPVTAVEPTDELAAAAHQRVDRHEAQARKRGAERADLAPFEVTTDLPAAVVFFEKPLLVRVAAIWTIPGLLVWFVYVVLAWGVFLTSTLAHIGGLAVAAVALKTYRMDRHSWRYAFGWSLLVQLISRFATAPELNVNVAHTIQPGWERTFPSYWMFWLTLTIISAVLLWLSGLLMRSLWPTVESSRRTAASVL